MTRGADRAADAGEQRAGEPADASAGPRWRRPWRRGDDDEDDGPFFPADTATQAGKPASANGASPSDTNAAPAPAPAPAASPSGRPRPGPRPRPRPAVDQAPTEAATGPAEAPERPVDASSEAADEEYRDPAIDRFIAATEPQPGDDDPEPKEPMRRRRKIRGSRGLRIATRLLIIVGVVAVIAVVLRAYVVAPYYIPSASMEPALRGGGGTNDRILVDKVSYHVHDPHQGDIVVFDRPDTWKEPYKTLVKRVIGLPGDIVSLRRGLVYVNGTRLTENYVDDKCGAAPSTPHTRTSQWRVPMNDYFVMGDNRCDSEDSRDFGPIPQSKIVGRAFLIVWPLSRFGSP